MAANATQTEVYPAAVIMRGRMKLVHALIVKSIAETVLVAALAVGFYTLLFPPTYHGWSEVQPHAIAGWAVNGANAAERLEVQLYVDDKFISGTTANLRRPDVVAAGWAADEWHGFQFPSLLLQPGFHEARVYVLHQGPRGKQRTLQLLGDPVSFSVRADGTFDVINKALATNDRRN